MNFSEMFEKDQKKLFLGLRNAFSYCNEDDNLPGIYLITNKNNDLMYIGQSKNIASRLSTHLSGKYQKSHLVYILSCPKEYLLDVENLLINTLKPIDNILVPRGSSTPDVFNENFMSLENAINYKKKFCYIIDVKNKILYQEIPLFLDYLKSINNIAQAADIMTEEMLELVK